LTKDLVKIVTAGIFANKAGAMLLRPLWRGRSTVFVLHRLNAPSAPDSMSLEHIEANLNALRKAGARFVPLSYLVDLAVRGLDLEPGCVAFTIDDGYVDQGVMAKKAFADNGVPVTMFLITGLLDGMLWPWDHRVDYALRSSAKSAVRFAPTGALLELATPQQQNAAVETVQVYCKTLPSHAVEPVLEELFATAAVNPPTRPPESQRALTWDEVRELEAAGIDFAPHSVSHNIASRLSAEEARREIQGSWDRLKQELSRPLPIYAWPTGRSGDFSERDLGIAAEVGMRAAVSVTNDYAQAHRNGNGATALPSLDRFSMSPSLLETIQYGTGLERLKQIVRFSR
jgi:peptidoglycan/xylan/chitin deacetylase (PgdA/CDA1 family)